MRKLATSVEMRALDTGAIRSGVPGLVLMEHAGHGTFEAIREHVRAEDLALGAVILCGKGNNGGDGFVIGRKLLEIGIPAVAYLLGRVPDLAGDAAVNAQAFIAAGGPVVPLAAAADIRRFRDALEGAGLAVDALFGTGLNSPVKGIAAQAIDALNYAGIFVCSVDIPSGISADNGAVMKTAVQADLTVTYGLEKPGQFLEPGRTHCGYLLLVPIPIPDSHIQKFQPSHELVDPAGEGWDAELRSRENNSHKGTYGHVLVLAGTHGKSGAAVLAALGAHAGGAGLVTIAVPQSLEPVVAARQPETMTLLLSESTPDGWAPETARSILDALTPGHVLVLGPGIPVGKASGSVLQKILAETQIPVVLDADGLNLLANLKKAPKIKDLVLTPHPGEAARLLGTTTAKIQADRVGAARALAKKYAATIALKGAGTVIAAPGKAVRLNPTGTPAMSTGGMGDLLAGFIGGMLASTSLDPVEAVTRAVWIHGRAAEMAEARTKRPSVLATEVFQYLGEAFEETG